MGSSVNEFQAAKLQEEMRVACRSLEKIGYESLVIVASQDSHTEMGSERGRHFIESFDLMVEFLRYCQGSAQEDHDSKPIAILSAPPAEAEIIKAELDTFEEDVFDTGFPTTGSDQDGAGDEMDFDIDEKPKMTTEGIVIPKDKIVVLEHAPTLDVVKKKSRNRRSLNDSTNMKWTAQTTISKPKKQSKKSVPKTHGKFPEPSKKTYDCDECNKKYARSETLTYHIRSIHTGERPYKCRDCGKAFVSRTSLRSHKYTHADITPFVCKTCGQLFKRKDYLWHHELTHSSVKQFVCEFCSVAFTDPSTLRQHRMIHTDSRPHCCEICGNSFRSPGALRDHQRVHTGEKPFTCETCGESFRRKKNMVTHQKRKHAL